MRGDARQEEKACGRGNNHAGGDQHDYVPPTTGPGRGSVRCGLNTLRRDVERPRKNQSDWKSDEQQQNHQAQRPVWQFPCWKGGRSQLDDAAGSNDVGRRHPINFAPFYFLEEAGHKKSFDSGTILQP